MLGWGGCWGAGCAYGAEIKWAAPIAGEALNFPDLYGVIAPRWPTQILGIGWALLMFGVVGQTAQARWPQGTRGLATIALIALGAFGISFLRGDPTPLFYGLRLDIVSNGLMLAGAVIAGIWLTTQKGTGAAPPPPATEKPGE